ncbi:MAG: DUF4153 domain-containing protein, partial [Rikenellaceae bacterium]|nr:DUF4153 domain-containing protein [Rikenellaceae bacterium]
AYLPLTGKRVMEWFYDRFPPISLPALAMFWIGVFRRVGEYGLTEGRIYLLICGAAMTFTVLMFLVPRQAAYRWPVLGGALLFSLFAFFPGITASELAVDSQQKRFDAVAARLGMLDVEGRLILEKRPEATEAQQEDYSALYDAYEYVYRHSDSMDMEARYGIPDIDRLTDEVMPDNMPRGQLYGNGNSVYLTDFGRRLDVDIRKYASLHSLRHDYSDDGPWQDPSYYYRTDSVGLTIFTPEGDTLFSRPLSLILERQLAKVGIGPVPDISTAGELEKRFGEMMFYEDGNFGIVFESMEISIDGATLTLTGLGAKELLLKE